MFLRRATSFALRSSGVRCQSTQSAAPAASKFVSDFLTSAPGPSVPLYDPIYENLDIDTSADISSSRPKYSQHVLVHTGRRDWPSKIELEPESKVGELKKLFRERVEEESRRKGKVIDQVAIHNTDHISPERCISISILPQGHTYTFPKCTSTKEIFRLLSEADKPRLPADSPVGVVRTALREPVILICGHASRDPRCGTLGPALASAFKSTAPKASIAMISHVGGHKYAGNVLIYTKRGGKWAGDWYGRVTPEDVPGLWESVKQGKIWRKEFSWRGSVEW